MKAIIKILALLLHFVAIAQDKELYVSYQDFGFHKQPKTVTKVHYEFLDKVVDQSKEVFEFDTEGNITTYTKINFANDNKTTKNIFIYENGLLVEERQVLPTPEKSKWNTTTYEYNQQKQLVNKVKIYDRGVLDRYYYYYKKGKIIKQEKVSLKGATTLTQDYLYNKEGKLYQVNLKETMHLKENKHWTASYLDGFKIFELDDDHKSSFLYTYDENIEIQYIITGKQLLQDLQDVQKTLSKSDYTGADEFQELLFDTNQLYANNQKMINRMNYHKKNQYEDIITTVGIMYSAKNKTENIAFQEIIYADGSKSGTTDFNLIIYNEMKKVLN
ncbi:MAG: hypothetical protein ACK5NK_07760 [Niabella sp.]